MFLVSIVWKFVGEISSREFELVILWFLRFFLDTILHSWN